MKAVLENCSQIILPIDRKVFLRVFMHINKINVNDTSGWLS